MCCVHACTCLGTGSVCFRMDTHSDCLSYSEIETALLVNCVYMHLIKRSPYMNISIIHNT